jgi:hypothetical protein
MKLALFAVVLVLFFATGVITLLGIVQRVKIEQKYLNKLFSALVLELVIAVLYLFGATDFFTEPPENQAQQQKQALLDSYFPSMTAADIEGQLDTLVALSKELKANQEALSLAQQKYVKLQPELVNLRQQLREKGNQNLLLSRELEVRKADTLRLSKLERLFLVRMAELSSKISEWGTSVNLQWRADEKREIALMLQEAFKEIGFMQELEIPNNDPALAYEVLVRYQTVKNFKESGFLTQQTVAFIIQDYLASSNSHFLASSVRSMGGFRYR